MILLWISNDANIQHYRLKRNAVKHYPQLKKRKMEKEKKIEKAKQVFRRMLVDEYGIKSADQFFSTEGEEMAEIYESMKIEQENFNLTDDELNNLLDSIFDEM